MIDANTSAMHAHLDDEERRERIGQRAEELAREMAAADLGDWIAIASALEDEPKLVQTLVDALAFNNLDRFRGALVTELMQRRRDEAIAQAEGEAI